MERKLCSVVIPVYNCSETIGQTIQSALNQSYSNLEILVIDDQSTDKSLEIVKDLAEKDERIRIIKNRKNLGVAQSRNIGFEKAKGEYVALLDGDDAWEPRKLEQQIAVLQNTNFDFCYSSYSYINDIGKEVGLPHIVRDSCAYKDLLKENYICCSSVILRSDLTKNHKMISEFFHEDFVYWLELLKVGYSGIGCNQVLVKYRVSQQGRSYNKLSAAKNRWLIYRKYCKLNTISSLYYFVHYTINGLLKYRKLRT